MKHLAIEVDDIYLSYITQKKLSIKDLFRRKRDAKRDEFQALKGISFEVETGKILGIVGRNGSGKSTLLRAIGGIFAVDKGRIQLFENKATLLSIGVGFNYLLTGRENVILSGLLTGYTRDEIAQRMDNIIQFSEIGDFIDKPVSTYSSGMYSKLAFSLATELDTDILLIDEVLSVGDESFALKSYERMKQLIKDREHTVVIVSHNLNILEDLCDQILWINAGKVEMLGEPSNVLQQYKTSMHQETGET
jgi:ABC-type polysaccharide/polyol phosphate transport system ATPase subunit